MTTVAIYKGTPIYRLFPSGYYQAYTGGRFRTADTLSGIKKIIRENGGEQ